jgi:hypothetical protein
MDVKSDFLKGFKAKQSFVWIEANLKAWYSRIDGYFLNNRFVKCLHKYVIYVKIKESGDTLIVCLYVDDLIFIGNNVKMFKDFKQTMIKEFEMMDIGLMTYYLGIEIKQEEYGIFVNQEKFIKEILKNFKMKDCAKVNTRIECGEKMSKNDKVEKINSTIFESVIRSLRYLICTHLDILFRVRLVSKFMETPIITHFKALKRIL